MLQFKDLPAITGGKIISEADGNRPVEHLLTDSRKLAPTDEALFIAIKGYHHNGHDFIPYLLKAGITQFIVEQNLAPLEVGANVLQVKSSIAALQLLAKHKRAQYDLPVIGITGSNGKTIVKEWLGQLLSPYQSVVKSPGSYNSQLGVPLSIWGMQSYHEIAIIEAGISKRGEMSRLEKIIQPTIGIFTNIGTAHDEGFQSMEEKTKEKARLFQHTETVIYCKDHTLIDSLLKSKGYTWGFHKSSDIVVEKVIKETSTTTCQLNYKTNSLTFTLPFTDSASLENVMHCISLMIFMGYSQQQIQEGLYTLKTVKMRLELKRGINGCQLIDDTYNSDLAGVQVALDFLASQGQNRKKSIIISDLLQTGLSKATLYEALYQRIQAVDPVRIIAIGPDCSSIFTSFEDVDTYLSTQDFIEQFDFDQLDKELILVKGARSFAFEKIVSRLEEKIHGTHLEINLDALTHNLNYYRGLLKPDTKMMVMVKAFAYGSGSLEIANLLQHHRVDYLGVAYADEGVALRNSGITMPVMVMNPSEESFDKLTGYNLEPELYNPAILRQFIDYLGEKPASIHIKLDTGMHRLGFKEAELAHLIDVLKNHPNLIIKSIFSHLAGADEALHNDYSKQQAQQFVAMSQQITAALKINPLLHLLNSPGIVRFPEYHFDMVRLGIGLYGIEATNMAQNRLQPISSLKTIVSQINTLKTGDTVGYSRKGEVKKDTKVATIAIGYADGFFRAFSNGVGRVFIKGKKVPVIGNVCMDMTMVDVTDIPDVQEGDEVEIFGEHITISEVAGFINTIPYEILTSVSQRVKRVYYSG